MDLLDYGLEHTSLFVKSQVAGSSGGPEHTSHFVEPQVVARHSGHMWLYQVTSVFGSSTPALRKVSYSTESLPRVVINNR